MDLWRIEIEDHARESPNGRAPPTSSRTSSTSPRRAAFLQACGAYSSSAASRVARTSSRTCRRRLANLAIAASLTGRRKPAALAKGSRRRVSAR
jgi:hypothetical protein